MQQSFTILTFFLQSRQPIFVQLLSAAYRVAQCSWLSCEQRTSVEKCIKILSEKAKERNIAVPTDLELQVANMFRQAALKATSGKKWLQRSGRGMQRDISSNR